MNYIKEELYYSHIPNEITEDGKYKIKSFNGISQLRVVIDLTTGKKAHDCLCFVNTDEAKKYIESLYD